MFHQASVVVRFGEDLAPAISVRGDGFNVPKKETGRSLHSGSLLLKGGVVDLSPEDTFPIVTDCSCLRSAASNLSTPRSTRSSSIERRLSDRFTQKRGAGTEDEAEEDEDDALQLSSLIKTLRRFSGKHLTPTQAKNIARLAKSFIGKETLTTPDANYMLGFLDSDNPAIQESTLLTLGRLIAKGEGNVPLLFKEYQVLWEEILSLASDAPTIEVHLAAMKAIENVTTYHEYFSHWEGPVEDIVYPLIHATIKNRESSVAQKTSCLGIMRNLSHIPVFAARVKQDVVSQLLSAHDSSHIKGLYLLLLYENLKSSRQRISTDILDNALLPVLVSMLQQGPCNTQQQSLKLLNYFVEDDVSRNSLLTTPQTVADILLCVRYSKCRKVRASCLAIVEQLLATHNVVQARQLMECNTESMAFENIPKASKYVPKEDRVSSPIRKKSRAEAELWQNFDALVGDLIWLLEREACLYREKCNFSCGLSLIGSINSDQLTCISSLIGCFTKLCMWPIQRPRKNGGTLGKSDEVPVLDFCADFVSNINRHHTLDIWAKVGRHVMAIFRQVLKRIPLPPSTTQSSTTTSIINSSTRHSKAGAGASTEKPNNDVRKSINNSSSSQLKRSDNKSVDCGVNLSSHLHPGEYALWRNLTEFILVISLASCSFQGPSNEVIVIGVGTNSDSNGGGKRKKAVEQAERETLTDRRFLRCNLIEEGVMSILRQLLMHDDEAVQIMSTTALRMCLQSMTDSNDSKTNNNVYVQRQTGKSSTRPQSATGRLETGPRHTLNQQVFQMGRPGIGSRPQSSIPYLTDRSRLGNARPSSARTSQPMYVMANTDTVVTDPGRVPTPRHAMSARPGSAASTRYEVFYPLTPRSEQKQLYLRTGEPVMQTVGSGRVDTLIKRPSSSRPARSNEDERGGGGGGDARSKRDKSVSFDEKQKTVREFSSNCWQDTEEEEEEELKSPINPKGDILTQCCQRAFLAAGESSIQGIFSKSRDLRRSCLLFLHDLVKQGTNEIHMKLSKLGCIPKLVDFLRMNDEDELLEITGLTIARMMVSSDRRLCQLFNRHGGTTVLMALLKKYQDSPPLKKEVCSTLNAVNNTMHPSMAESVSDRGPTDVWEHIMQRWTEEDEVVTVLKKFL